MSFDLEKTRAICAAATPGPWVYRSCECDDWGIVRSAGALGYPVAKARPGANYNADAHRAAGTDPCESNGQFIAHARAALPAACDEIERLRALCEQASHEIERLSFGDEVEMTQRIIQCLKAAAEGLE